MGPIGQGATGILHHLPPSWRRRWSSSSILRLSLLHQEVEVDRAREGRLPEGSLEDRKTGRLVGERDVDWLVGTTGSE